MIILGIDPGLRYAGFCILKKEGAKTFLLHQGFLSLPQQKNIPERVTIFYTFFKDLITTYHVSHLALETPFLGKNAQNFLKLGYLRGILYLLSEQHSLGLFEFAPMQIKSAITGFGGASKEQVARVILQLFPLLKKPEKEDVTDAIAITLCALWQNKIIPSYLKQ